MKIVVLILSLFVFSLVSITFFSSCYAEDDYTPLQGKGDLRSYLAINNDNLYVINQNELLVYQLSSGGDLTYQASVDNGTDIKSIFVREQKLFVRTSYGLYIYELSQSDEPNLIFQNSNFLLCDAVDLTDKYLFNTVRIDDNCHYVGKDALEVIDIRSPTQTAVLQSFFTDTPYDVAIDGTLLFLCRGNFGLQVFDITDPANFTLLKSYTDIKGTRIVAEDGLLIVMASNGIDQYNYADLNDIKLLSHLPIQ